MVGSPPPIAKPRGPIYDPLDPNYDPDVPQTQSSASKRPPPRRNLPHQAEVPLAPGQHPSSAYAFPRPHPLPPRPWSGYAATPPGYTALRPPEMEWSEHRMPTGQVYYYNHRTGESVWTKPDAMNAVPENLLSNGSTEKTAEASSTDRMPKGEAEKPASPPKEHALAMKKIPKTNWAIVLTSADHEFFYDMQTRVSVWEMPDELGELIGMLLAGGGIEDEADEEDHSGDESEKELDEAGERKRKRDDEEFDGDAEEAIKRARIAEEAKKRDGWTHEEKVNAFMELLKESDVNPYSTWEKELPKFVTDVRYTLIVHKERKKAFDEFCRIRVAEMRKEQSAKVKDVKERFKMLLTQETNFKSQFDDFARHVKRDPRFTSLKDPKEREKLFKEHIVGLRDAEAERKKLETQAAKDEFMMLLKETPEITPDSSFRSVRKFIESDRRFNAVRSSGEREAYFEEYHSELDGNDRAKKEEMRKLEERKRREEASLREREEQVRRERAERNRDAQFSRSRLLKDDAANVFRTILVDLVRNHDAMYEQKRSDLERDPRIQQVTVLDERERERIFRDHVFGIHHKRLDSFRELIEETCAVTATWDAVYSAIKDDTRVTRLLGISRSSSGNEDGEVDGTVELEREFARIQESRLEMARKDVVEAMRENRFVRFHVRNAVQNVEAAAKEEGRESEKMEVWKKISIDEVRTTLEEDRRYLEFRTLFPEECEKYLLDHLKALVRDAQEERGGTLDRTIAANAGAFGLHSESKRRNK
ncbi:hypothetical protein BJ742DRAFT_845641 [Cladochytrium replicatum]|nr:hypothetical protein BJ742DRAFT_845641 [Cladochytrium replicatum]